MGWQGLTNILLNNPEEVLQAVGASVVVVNRLQEEMSVWDFLLGLPDLFLKPTDQEKLRTGAEELGNLKKQVLRKSVLDLKALFAPHMKLICLWGNVVFVLFILNVFVCCN